MATISSHLLNGLNGTHADGVRVQLTQLKTGSVLFDTTSCDGGRLSELVSLNDVEAADEYELVFHVGDYWKQQHASIRNTQTMRTVVLRFSMPDREARYHMPVILNPNSYACWWSKPE